MTLCNEIEMLIREFWWGHDANKKKYHWVRWENLCEAKKEGGLEFRQLRIFNLSMLAKQGWRLLHYDSSLLAQVLKARYYPSCSFMQSSVGYNPSFTWRSIYNAKSVLDRGLCWHVGNGNSIQIWKDNWLPNQNGFKPWSPPNHLDAEARVSDLMHAEGHGWNESLIDYIFLPFEANQIKKIYISPRLPEDKLAWQHTRTGVFSVKSAYHMLKKEPDQSLVGISEGQQGDRAWQKIWSLNIPPKVKHFTWRLLRNSLPTKTNLLKRGLVLDTTCELCQEGIESLDHCFRDCPRARCFWFGSLLGLRFNDQSQDNFLAWFLKMMIKEDEEVGELVCMVAWTIWKERNKVHFEGQVRDPNKMLSFSVGTLLQFQNQTEKDQQQHSSPITQGWQPPATNRLKLNSDASTIDDRTWGLGVIVRDAAGGQVFSAHKQTKNAHSIAEAEALAVLFGLQQAHVIGIQQLDVETDCLSIVKLYHNNEPDLSYLGQIINDIKDLGSTFISFSFCHINRHCNKVAHWLAQLARTSVQEVTCIEDVPNELNTILVSDFPQLV